VLLEAANFCNLFRLALRNFCQSKKPRNPRINTSTVTGPVLQVLTMQLLVIGNESVPKTITNNTINLFFLNSINILLVSNHNTFRLLFDRTASIFMYFISKNIFVLALEMVSPGNQHCANSIGTLSFHIPISSRSEPGRQRNAGETI